MFAKNENVSRSASDKLDAFLKYEMRQENIDWENIKYFCFSKEGSPSKEVLNEVFKLAAVNKQWDIVRDLFNFQAFLYMFQNSTLSVFNLAKQDRQDEVVELIKKRYPFAREFHKDEPLVVKVSDAELDDENEEINFEVELSSNLGLRLAGGVLALSSVGEIVILAALLFLNPSSAIALGVGLAFVATTGLVGLGMFVYSQDRINELEDLIPASII